MNETNESDEREAIRAAKRERLLDESGKPTTPVHVESPVHFEEIVADEEVVLVDFYADWCGPCKMLEPTMETLAADTDAVVAKVDVDALQSLAQRHNVQGVPTLLLYVDGEVAERRVGVQDEGTLRTLVEQAAN
ncbi:thioredoxin [Haloarcula marina]|uniref:thioredoxin n=1 Tax=Haloarcula marina TaxID=2961574 RepID=UPI0020B77754|nr:thioredoxin [Halomicroarcula marina]